MAPANQLRLSFAGSEDGEAETETCRAAKPCGERRIEPHGPQGLNSLNRRMRTRMYGGVAGEDGRPSPLCRFCRDSKQSSIGSLRLQRSTLSPKEDQHQSGYDSRKKPTTSDQKRPRAVLRRIVSEPNGRPSSEYATANGTSTVPGGYNFTRETRPSNHEKAQR